jgi:glucose-6-phosphate dehydrogenase assembly protein OpcA
MEKAVSDGASRVLAHVDEELRALWSVPPGAAEPIKSRACTMNLVVVAATPELASGILPVVDDVLQHLPARAIVVGLDPDGEDSLEATTTAVCTSDSGDGAAVCSERVTLVVRGTLCRRLPSCVSTLCTADVPMTLVWLARVHADDPAFAPLAREASRIVLDVGQSTLTSLSHVVRWTRGLIESERPGVADLAWTRLAPWQELCSRMFDPPRLRPLAQRVTRVCLVQASPDGGPLGSESALLLGWLASRLGWKAASLAGKLRVVRPDGGQVHTQLRAQAAPWTERGTVLRVELDAAADGISLRGEIVRGEQAESDAATWRVDVTEAGETRRLEQHMRLRGGEPARLLERTLHRPARDEALAEAVSWADEVRGEELICDSAAVGAMPPPRERSA